MFATNPGGNVMISLTLAAVLALAIPQAEPKPGTIEGRVLRVGTREPIPNVQVTLVKQNSGAANLSNETVAAMDSLQRIIAANPDFNRVMIDSLVRSRETALGLVPGTLKGIWPTASHIRGSYPTFR